MKCKTTFEALSAKANEYSKVRMCFYQCCSYHDWYQNWSTSLFLSLFLLGFSITGLRNETEAANSTPSGTRPHY